MNLSIPLTMLCLIIVALLMLVRNLKAHKVTVAKKQIQRIDQEIEKINDHYKIKQLLKLRKKISKKIDNY